MKIRIAGLLPTSLNNGDGVRYVVFTQGCEHHCKGCQNPDTWSFDGGKEYDTAMIALAVQSRYERGLIDGITLSGGDPFYQQEACVDLLKKLNGINAWVYTGFKYEDIQDTELASLCNVIVDGEYIEELKCEGELYGSSNQRIIRLDENCDACQIHYSDEG